MAVMNGKDNQRALALLQGQQGPLSPNVLARMQEDRDDELGGGITGGFAVVSVRGKVFRVKHRGEERPIMRADGDGPKASIEVVIVQSSPAIAKVFYVNGYVEGSNAPPDCWSVNGVVPDPGAPKQQSTACVGCPQNAWGSANRPGGTSKGKACADTKRIAIVPAEDMKNELYGGPMLMRVPPASLGAVKGYSDALKTINYKPYGVVTRISFDPTTEYPALTFEAVRALTDEEFELVYGMRNTALMDRILNTALDHVETDGVDKSHVPVAQSVAALGKKVPDEDWKAVPQTVTPEVKLPPLNEIPAEGWKPAPEAPTPVQKSVERIAEVEQKASKDPNAAQRAALRANGVPEETITKVLGPEPQEAPEDPERAKYKAMGLSDAQIDLLVGGKTPEAASEPKKPRGRPAKKKEETPPVDVKSEEAEDTSPPQDEAALGALPADFENMLKNMLPPAKTDE